LFFLFYCCFIAAIYLGDLYSALSRELLRGAPSLGPGKIKEVSVVVIIVVLVVMVWS